VKENEKEIKEILEKYLTPNTVESCLSKLREISEFRDKGKIHPDDCFRYFKGIQSFREDPNIIEMFRSFGRDYFHKNEYDKASEYYNQILNVKPDDKHALERKIESLRHARHFDEAIKILDEKSKQARIPLNTKIMLQKQRGWFHFDQKQYKKAIEAFSDDIFSQMPKEEYDYKNILEGKIASFRLQRLLKDAEDFLDSLDTDILESSSILNERGRLYFDQKLYEKAINTFKRVLEPIDCPRFHKIAAYEGIIASYRLLGDLEETKKTVKNAKEDLGEKEEAIVNQEGWIYFDESWKDSKKDEESLENARKKFKEAEKIAKHWPQPRFNQIEVLSKFNRQQEIEKIIEELKRDFRSDLEVKEQIGWVYLLQNKVSKAEKEFREILQEDKDNIWGGNGLGAVCLAKEEYEKAEILFLKILEAEPKSPIFLTNLALTLVRQDEPKLDEAEKHCNEALDQDHEYAPAFLCLSVIAFRRGRYSESEYYLQKSIEIGMRGSYTDLGALYIQMGKYEEAEINLEKAIKINPNEIQASLERGILYFFLFQKKASKIKKSNKKIREEIIDNFQKAHGNCKKLYEESIKNDPNNGVPDRVYVLILMQSCQFEKLLKGVFKQEEALKKAKEILQESLQRLDHSKRWQIHLTLAQLLYSCGERKSTLLQRVLSNLKIKSSSSTYYEEALKEANMSKTLNPTHPAPYFYSGIIQYKLKEYEGAIEDFKISKDIYSKRNGVYFENELYFEVKRYSSYVESLIRSKGDRWTLKNSLKWFWGTVLIPPFFLFFWRLYFGDGSIILAHWMPVITSYIIASLVGPFLPLLRRIKLPMGIEAEIKPTGLIPPEIPISLGPTGEVGFGSLLPTVTSGSLGSRLNRPSWQYK